MSRKRGAPRPQPPQPAQRTKRTKLWWLLGGALAMVVVASLFGLYMLQHANASAPEKPRSAYHVGGVMSCRPQPAFAQRLGYSRQAVLSSRERTEKGLVLYEPDTQGNPTRVYQDPSWTQAGFLSPPVIDQDGNVYVAAVPNINVLDNPANKANVVHRIDANTGVLTPFLTLPQTAAPSIDNPFGIIGLTYDCDTNSLYASSVAGSTRTTVAGRIFRVDLATGQVASRLDAVDAFGIVVYNTAHGKRLLFGLARSAVVRSVALDENGNFTADIRDELSLAGMGVHGDERARRLQVDAKANLIVRTIAFSFNLTAPTDPRQTEFHYAYDNARNTWRLVSASPIS